MNEKSENAGAKQGKKLNQSIGWLVVVQTVWWPFGLWIASTVDFLVDTLLFIVVAVCMLLPTVIGYFLLRKRARAVHWVSYAVRFVIINALLIGGVAIVFPVGPSFNLVPGEEMTKEGLHRIQLAVERYAEGNEGCYPSALLGGEYLAEDVESAVDPLIARGYLREYPINPMLQGNPPGKEAFLRWLYFHAPFLLKEEYRPTNRLSAGSLDELQEEYGDPYKRNGESSRFGYLARPLMGNVADTWEVNGEVSGYPFWEADYIGASDKWSCFLAGNFAYIPNDEDADGKVEGYTLLAFGPSEVGGMDFFRVVEDPEDGWPNIILDPDGKPDGVIIFLHGGWPWEE